MVNGQRGSETVACVGIGAGVSTGPIGAADGPNGAWPIDARMSVMMSRTVGEWWGWYNGVAASGAAMAPLFWGCSKIMIHYGVVPVTNSRQ